ncbi:molybdenum ABC transporter substrate-binding protein [Croceibacterium mercuriale]|uniref:Molybdenum ABC transporter substrate-binding protein n=1 Tax=Croceibacterium mercuriale TaxID=1572751 RepID=A0A0B2BZA0_9SPHN|nr:molybdenum ABC transporter substrate-binding protein [Croceibacterium mercuriale]
MTGAAHALATLVLATFCLLLTACSLSAERDGAEGPVVLAAASLQEALTDAGQAWAAAGHPSPRLSFAGSGALARQVEAGAPADLFISADEQWMDYLATRGLLRAGSRRIIATGELVLVARPGSAATAIVALRDGRLALADPDAVPAGRYARAALQATGWWARVAPRIVPAENVRAALALVERGEVPLGIIYASDARTSPAVRVIHRFAPADHPPIRYPAAVPNTATNPDAAAFLDFLASAEGQRILAARGLGPAGG